MTTAPTREQVEALLADLAAHFTTQKSTALFDRMARLTEAYLAGLDAADRARLEELEGMREWCENQGYGSGSFGVIAELDRRIAAIRERKS